MPLPGSCPILQVEEGMLDEIKVILGDLPFPDADFIAHLREKGREWNAAPLPETVERGGPKLCFMNATQTFLERDDLDYCEGIGFIPSLPGFAFLHAWCVDATGNVVDPTWDRPESCRYYGVRFPRGAYTRHIFRTRVYGVYGGANKSARKVLAKGRL